MTKFYVNRANLILCIPKQKNQIHQKVLRIFKSKLRRATLLHFQRIKREVMRPGRVLEYSGVKQAPFSTALLLLLLQWNMTHN
jgi:hypothetical protein